MAAPTDPADPTDPTDMTPEQRLTEVCAILTESVLRLDRACVMPSFIDATHIRFFSPCGPASVFA